MITDYLAAIHRHLAAEDQELIRKLSNGFDGATSTPNGSLRSNRDRTARSSQGPTMMTMSDYCVGEKS
jgi:hypothetical protein